MTGKTQLLFGLVGGLLFYAHAMVNNSHAWPLIWPFLAGALAVLITHTGKERYGADLRKAAVVGVIAAILFFAATAVTLSQMMAVAEVSLAGLAMAAGIGLIAALVGGGLAHPFARERKEARG